MSAPVALRSQYSDLYGSSMLPMLEELFRAEMAMHPSRRSQLFKIVPHDRDIWQSSELHDLEQYSEVAEGSEYSFKRAKQGASKTLSMKKMGLGVSISEEAVDDGKFDLIGDMIRKLARSGQETQEVDAMNIFNNGFSAETTADGVAVFSTAHTLPSGLTFRNRLSTDADLSATSLDTMLTDFETQFYGDTGIYYKIQPKVLLVHSSQRRYAQELVGSELKPDSADNNSNSLKGEGLMVVSSPHLTDTDAWYLCAAPSETGLRIISRKPIETKSWVDEYTDSILYRSRYREKIGVTHPYGLFASSGA
jgi:phage major head subunit gpT-like protein